MDCSWQIGARRPEGGSSGSAGQEDLPNVGLPCAVSPCGFRAFALDRGRRGMPQRITPVKGRPACTLSFSLKCEHLYGRVWRRSPQQARCKSPGARRPMHTQLLAIVPEAARTTCRRFDLCDSKDLYAVEAMRGHMLQFPCSPRDAEGAKRSLAPRCKCICLLPPAE